MSVLITIAANLLRMSASIFLKIKIPFVFSKNKKTRTRSYKPEVMMAAIVAYCIREDKCLRIYIIQN